MGDVLVAETGAPASPADSLMDRIVAYYMRKAGAGALPPTASACCAMQMAMAGQK